MSVMCRTQSTLRRVCAICEYDVELELPEHPAGLASCPHCGGRLDLADNTGAKLREYLACYESAVGTKES